MISVIMPAYNAEKTIRQAIDSVLSQTYRDLELIVINDCAKDATKGIIEEYMAKDDRVRMIDNKVNSGVSVSRNKIRCLTPLNFSETAAPVHQSTETAARVNQDKFVQPPKEQNDECELP